MVVNRVGGRRQRSAVVALNAAPEWQAGHLEPGHLANGGLSTRGACSTVAMINFVHDINK
jgi:hypothetical protein